MKKKLLLISLMLLGYVNGIMAQSPKSNDFVIVGAVSGDQNMEQIESRYRHRPNVFFTVTSAVSGAEQISKSLEGRKIHDLHIYVNNDQQGLFLTDVPVTLANANDFSAQFSEWKKSVSGKVVVHNQTGIVSPVYLNLLDKLKELTGIEIELKQ